MKWPFLFLFCSSWLIGVSPDYLETPYYYVTSGMQTRVYRSADFQTVIKLLETPQEKENHLSFKGVLRRAEKRFHNKLKSSQSYFIAFQEFPDETGLIDLHLRLEKNHPMIVWLADERTLPSHLDLSQHPFLVQTYASPFSDFLNECMEKNRPDLALEAIDQALIILERVVNKGYWLADPNLLKNWGMTQEGPIIIDVGEFRRLPKSGVEKKIKRMMDKTLFSLYVNYPELRVDSKREHQKLGPGDLSGAR